MSTIIRFYAKPDTDFKKYGFSYDNFRKSWRYEEFTLRIEIKKDFSIRVNNVSNSVLLVFYRMVKDGVVYFKESENKPIHYHYIGLTDEEFNLIQEKRNYGL